MKSKILIYNINHYGGGTLVLSELCTALREQGYNASLFFAQTLSQNANQCKYEQDTYIKTGIKTALAITIWKLFPFQGISDKLGINKHFPLHALGRKIKWFPIFSKRHTIVVYPETVYGNPLNAKKIVRWQLFNYQFKTDYSAFSKSDLFLGYREVFNDRSFTPNIQNIHINSFNATLYKRYNFNGRDGKCYIIRKGYKRSDLPKIFDGPIIDNLPEEEKVRVFNQCEYCYSYDTQTFYSSIAAICGCKSIVVPEPGKCMSDYLTTTDTSYGVAWSDNPEDIERAMKTVDLLKDQIKESDVNNRKEAERLVKILESYFNTKVQKICRLTKIL